MTTVAVAQMRRDTIVAAMAKAGKPLARHEINALVKDLNLTNDKISAMLNVMKDKGLLESWAALPRGAHLFQLTRVAVESVPSPANGKKPAGAMVHVRDFYHKSLWPTPAQLLRQGVCA